MPLYESELQFDLNSPAHARSDYRMQKAFSVKLGPVSFFFTVRLNSRASHVVRVLWARARAEWSRTEKGDNGVLIVPRTGGLPVLAVLPAVYMMGFVIGLYPA